MHRLPRKQLRLAAMSGRTAPGRARTHGTRTDDTQYDAFAALTQRQYARLWPFLLAAEAYKTRVLETVG